MSKLTINIGTAPNSKNGDSIRDAFAKVNSNFTELYNTASADVQIPPQTGNVGKYLTTNGTALSWATGTGGTTDYNNLTNRPTIPTSFSSLVNGSKTVSLASTGVLSLPAQGLLTNVNQIASATINRTGASTDTAAIQEAWDIWYSNEILYRTYLDQEVQPGFPPRPWFNKPSWEGYPLIMEYNSAGGGGGGGGQLPPNPNLAPVAKTAVDSYLAYKELVSDIDIVSGNKAFSFENTGELSLPATLVFKDAANAKIVLKYTDQYGYVVEDTSIDKAWTFNANGSLTFPDATTQTTAWTGSVGSLVNGLNNITLNATGALAYPNSALQRDTGTISCPGNASTVVYTALGQYQHTIKLLIQVEGTVGAAVDMDTQACEMIIAKSFRADAIAASVYGVVHTSVAPLATFTAEWNSLINRVEVFCTTTAIAVSVRTFATEITTAD
jgi:hypothetical protein